MDEREPEVEAEDLEVTDDDAEDVRGGAYEAYVVVQGQKQGANKGTSTP